MNFIRELETRVYKEEDNIWIEPDGHVIKERFQLIGTQVIVKVRDVDRRFFRGMSFHIRPEESLESDEVKEMMEEYYKICESYLLRDMKKASQWLAATQP
jgi:hypothetical protein